jgi:acetylornithine deacetylase/succinyl-diaminopimelate desuccinylase-like protein
LEFLDLCKKMIQIESTPSTGNEEVVLFCAELCRQGGMEVTLQEAELRGLKQFNLIARPKSHPQKDTSEEIIFQSHLDTVEPGPLTNWTKTDNNPFNMTREGEKVYGLGTADVKLDFLCKFTALKEFTATKQRRPFALVGTFGEEIGMHGAHHLMATKAVNAKMAIIGEPSELQIVYANNGYMILTFQIPFSEQELARRTSEITNTSMTQEKMFRGKAAHSSTPHLGDNAILKLVTYLEKMPKGMAIIEATGGVSDNTVPAEAHVELDAGASLGESVGDKIVKLVRDLQRLESEFLNFDNKEFSPSYPTLNVAILKTTDKALDLRVSFRITPDVPMEQVEKWMTYCEERARDLGCICERSRLSPPAFTALNSELVKGALEIAAMQGLSTKPITKASGTESSVYCEHGLECIVFGPGVSVGNSHTANEYNLMPQLEKASAFYTEAVKRFCL